MKPLTVPLLVAALAYLGIVVFLEARTAMAAEVVDQSRVVMLFGSLVVIGLVAGILLVVKFLPVVGDWAGNLFFNPNEMAEKAPHADALAAVARGDYEQAVAAYRRCVADDPHDTHALSEIVHLYADKLDNPASAAEALEEALAQERPPEEIAFLSLRLADIAWTHQHDARRAREILLEVCAQFPNTKHSANAQHSLQEIERQLATEG